LTFFQVTSSFITCAT